MPAAWSSPPPAATPAPKLRPRGGHVCNLPLIPATYVPPVHESAKRSTQPRHVVLPNQTNKMAPGHAGCACCCRLQRDTMKPAAVVPAPSVARQSSVGGVDRDVKRQGRNSRRQLPPPVTSASVMTSSASVRWIFQLNLLVMQLREYEEEDLLVEMTSGRRLPHALRFNGCACAHYYARHHAFRMNKKVGLCLRNTFPAPLGPFSFLFVQHLIFSKWLHSIQGHKNIIKFL